MISACEFDVIPRGMEVATVPPFIEISNIGLKLANDLTLQEWLVLGENFGNAMKKASWCIGDWMVYGEKKWGRQTLFEGDGFDEKCNRIPSDIYEKAVACTKLDRQVLKNYAVVSRAFPVDKRAAQLSFSHHRVLAPLPPEKRIEWMNVTLKLSSPPSVQRLSMSIRIADGNPRIVSAQEITSRGQQAGHDNYGVHMVRLMTVLRKDLPNLNEEQRKRLKMFRDELLELLKNL
jgi:hypothetical protein